MWQVWNRQKGVYRILVGNLTERDQLQDLHTDRKIILKFILRKLIVDCTDLTQDTDMTNSFECDNEPLDTIKCRKFLDYLKKY